MKDGIEAVEMFRCIRCGVIYSTKELATECAKQGDPIAELRKAWGFEPKVGQLLYLPGHWGWVDTDSPEWASDEKVKGNGIHKSDTWDIRFVVTRIRMQTPIRENCGHGGFRNHARDKDVEYIFRHHLIVEVATKAFNKTTGKPKKYGMAGWVSSGHFRMRKLEDPPKKLVDQVDEMVAYWSKPANANRIEIL